VIPIDFCVMEGVDLSRASMNENCELSVRLVHPRPRSCQKGQRNPWVVQSRIEVALSRILDSRSNRESIGTNEYRFERRDSTGVEREIEKGCKVANARCSPRRNHLAPILFWKLPQIFSYKIGCTCFCRSGRNEQRSTLTPIVEFAVFASKGL
jgi:hypothetical protein